MTGPVGAKRPLAVLHYRRAANRVRVTREYDNDSFFFMTLHQRYSLVASK